MAINSGSQADNRRQTERLLGEVSWPTGFQALRKGHVYPRLGEH